MNTSNSKFAAKPEVGFMRLPSKNWNKSGWHG